MGRDVAISRKISVYPGEEGIRIGNHVRIDDYCILVGNITIGNHIHIGSHCGLHASGNGRIVLEDYSGMSSNVQIYACSDLYDGEKPITRPGIDKQHAGIIEDTVVLSMYSQIGAGSVLLPGGNLGEGAVVGAMSLIKSNLEPWLVYAGIPCKVISERSKRCMNVYTYLKESKVKENNGKRF